MARFKNVLTGAALLLAGIACVTGLTLRAHAQTVFSLAPGSVDASQFNYAPIAGQGTNQFTFNLGATQCQGYPAVNGRQTPFFLFGNLATGAGYPVNIQDSTPANSEIVTPTSISASPATNCGFAASPVNTHVGFTVGSGSAGLEEAVGSFYNANSLLSPITVTIDWRFYANVAGLPGNLTPAALIRAIPVGVGSVGVQIVDLTTTPWTYYTWNGSQYVASGNPVAQDNLNVTSTTTIAAPAAVSTAAATYGLLTTATTGGTIPATSTYRVAITYVDASGGETTISTDTASTSTITTGSTATNSITLTSPAASAGAVGYRVYVSAAGGASLSEILYTPTCSSSGSNVSIPLQTSLLRTTVCPIGATATISAIVTGTATIPAISTAYPRTGGSSGSYVTFPLVGAQASTVPATLGLINLHVGELNSLGKTLTLCGSGNAATTATPGTLKLSLTLASVPGVTLITPWAVTSGTTTASAIVPYDFCVALTTSATGTSGTLQVHGWVNFGLAGTQLATSYLDTVYTSSSAIDLTKQDQIGILLTPTTTGTTAAQLSQLTANWSN